MPRTPEQNQHIKDKRRSKLLKFSLSVFAQKNYDDVAIDDITKVAHCSHGLFYHYFLSKPEVYRVVYEEIVTESHIAKSIEEMKNSHGVDTITLLAKLTEYAEKNEGNERNAFLFIIRSFASEKKEASGIDIDTKYDFRPHLIEAIEEAQKAGAVIEGNPKDLAYIYLSSLVNAVTGENIFGAKPRTISAKILSSILIK